jgi:predicted 2-oxoglutarate/Fe(II)-dependent dioxygenase YbiX
MTTETEILDVLTRRPGERYFSWIKRLKQNEEARYTKLLELDRDIRFFAEKPSVHWSELCRCAKAYGILIGEWRESKR